MFLSFYAFVFSKLNQYPQLRFSGLKYPRVTKLHPTLLYPCCWLWKKWSMTNEIIIMFTLLMHPFGIWLRMNPYLDLTYYLENRSQRKGGRIVVCHYAVPISAQRVSSHWSRTNFLMRRNFSKSCELWRDFFWN